jgi:hypothetical protein
MLRSAWGCSYAKTKVPFLMKITDKYWYSKLSVPTAKQNALIGRRKISTIIFVILHTTFNYHSITEIN